MKKVLLILPLIAVSAGTLAQNWQTVRTKDTNFYSVVKAVQTDYLIDSNRLRSMWVDSAKSLAGDSLFYFFRGIRLDTPYFSKCQDTLAPSWLGTHMIRKPDGTEHYVNSRGDTLTFRTGAGLSEHWIIAKDAAGRNFQGTVTSLTAGTVDGVPDSVKTISIQAMNGSVPVADAYNALIFQLSRAHGWLKTLDLYTFPNRPGPGLNPGAGLLEESLQHNRLPGRFGVWSAGNKDLLWRYAVGSDFITTHNYGSPYFSSLPQPPAPFLGGNEEITYDSVLAVTLLSPDKAAVTFFTRSFSRLWKFNPPGKLNGYTDTTFTDTYVHTDTITGNGGSEVRLLPLYESKHGPLPNGMPAGFDRYYFMDSMSNGKYSLEELWQRSAQQLAKTGGCWKWTVGSPDPEARITNWVEDFGIRMTFHYFASPMPVEYDKVEVTYASLPGLKWGNKINVLKLGVEYSPSSPDVFRLYPNPASDHIMLCSVLPEQVLEATLLNVSGQIIYQQSFSGTKLNIPTAAVAPGLYFLEVAGKEIRQRFKVVVRH